MSTRGHCQPGRRCCCCLLLQLGTVEECERLLEALLPPGFDRSLLGPITASMMAGPLSK